MEDWMNPKGLAQKLMDVWNSHKENEVNNVIGPNYVCHDPATPKDFGKGPEGFKQRFKMYNTAFPDSKFTVEEIFAEGEKAVVRWSVTAAHRGELFGIAATNKNVQSSGVSICHIQAGKIAEEWTYYDALGLMQQLGVVGTREAA
jgi:steroid delta-isomerase-like uncharacterized protein